VQAAVDAAGPSPIDAALAEAAAALAAEKSLDSVAAALERWRARASSRENVRRMQAAAAQSLAALVAPPERLRLAALDQTAQGQLPRVPLSRLRVRLPGVISPRRMTRMILMVGENKAAVAGASAADSSSVGRESAAFHSELREAACTAAASARCRPKLKAGACCTVAQACSSLIYQRAGLILSINVLSRVLNPKIQAIIFSPSGSSRYSVDVHT
jgi:hypothetical protein